MPTVLFCELGLHKDGATIAQPLKKQLLGLHDLTQFLLFCVRVKFFFSNGVNTDVIVVDITTCIMSLAILIRDQSFRNQGKGNR